MIGGVLGRSVVAAGVLVVAAGCHTYRPVQDAPIGSVVRVQVPVRSAVQRVNARPETASIEGHVVGFGDTIVLATRTRREFGAYREIIQFDTVRVGLQQTSAVELREFSAGRSVLLGAIIAAGAATAGILAFNAAGGGDDGPSPDPQPPETSVVISNSMLMRLWGLLVR